MFYMGGHVVGAFDGVAVEAIVLGHQANEVLVQVVDDVGVSVLLNGERGRSVLNEDRQQPGGELLIVHPTGDLAADVVEPLAVRADLKTVRGLLHSI